MVALLCGIVIAYLYRLTYNGTSYSSSYVQSLVAFAMITTIVIMVIGNNLARAFGLVGSMSIVRFRMAIKDTRDIVFIFFALAIGMACGVGQHMVAVLATIFIGIVILILSHGQFGVQHKKEYLLHFNYDSPDDNHAPYMNVFKKFCRKFKLINIRSVGESDEFELSYYIVLKDDELSQSFLKELGGFEGIKHLNFFFDEA